MKRVALAPPTFTPSSTPARGPARLSHPGARLASGFIDARVIKSKSYKVPVRAVRNKRPETKPAPPRHLDTSCKSGAPRHNVRAVDTRALLHVVEGGPGCACGRNKARVRAFGPPPSGPATGGARLPPDSRRSCPDVANWDN
jgi:hypothetical protein